MASGGDYLDIDPIAHNEEGDIFEHLEELKKKYLAHMNLPRELFEEPKKTYFFMNTPRFEEPPQYIWAPYIPLIVTSTLVIKPKLKTKCECGAEICRTTHSNWCPKYE